MTGRTAPPWIAVVVPAHNRPQGLARLLESLRGQTLPVDDWELVVVDSGSNPADSRKIRSLVADSGLRAHFVRMETNRGPAAARNVGWRASSAEFLAFTDDDCCVHPGWLEAGLEALRNNAKIGVVQGPTTRPANSDAYSMTHLTVVREVLHPSPWFEGCNLFFRREALEQFSGFDEEIGYAGEETSLCWRILEAGWERGWSEKAIVEHEISERPWKWHLKIHYLERNIVHLVARHPEMRAVLWRPWAVKRENALFAFALLGAVIAMKHRWGLLLMIPYLRSLPPPWRMGVVPWLHQVSAHAASLAGKLTADIEEHILVL